MKFNEVLFWCEFPLRADWKKLNEIFRKHGIKAKCYIAVESAEEFNDWKQKLRPYKDIALAGAWPTIPLEKGYWFSGFISSKEIDSLEQYKWLNLKIDIEPPFRYFKMLNVVNALLWALIHPFKKAKNSIYLKEKLLGSIKKNEIIMSTFPLPDFILKRYGFFRNSRFKYSFMFYSSMISAVFRPLYRLYYRWFIRHALNADKGTYFAVGLISKGIFNSEPEYNDASQLRKDLAFLLRNGAKNVVIYSMEGISQREDPEEWVQAISEFI